MARTKSGYRKYRDGGPVPSEITVDIDREPAANGGVTQQHAEALDSGLSQLQHQISPVDDASAALQTQINQLRQAESAQRQRNDDADRHAARMAEVNEILKANPEMVRNGDELVRAEKDAYAEGHEPYSPDFHRAVIRNFKGYMALKAQAPVAAAGSEFEPSYASSGRSIGGMVSAPVSRETFANGSYDSYGDRPGRVTLSISQKEAAKIAGISETDYAANVLRLRQEKADGRYGGEG
jgi:hypothetical protein